ncbi:MAG: hypothetical protein IT486_05950 [Gammaproteobacteria bacterium]|nr:hypothetical protein [Gammaproteobacteria bacterium]
MLHLLKKPLVDMTLGTHLLLGLVAAVAIGGTTTAAAADVTTVAGNGLATFSGDGGPATLAALSGPTDVAVAADGTVYIADSGNLRIRRISPGGVISTVAGNGTYGDGGDGGQATEAQLGAIQAIALSPADDILYLSDAGMNRVRQIDLGSGVITTFAGRGLDYIGHDGNGGPATSASIAIPEGIAVDPAGNVYFTEFVYCTVRKVDIATHVITRVAGSGVAGDCASDGDGGAALAARLGTPFNMATDAAGNLFVVDLLMDTVRRIDAVTHIITTIAGGGATPPGFGDASTMDLGDIHGIAIDDTDNLYVSNHAQVFKVDLDTGILSVFAGTGVTGFSGDGGPALDATFSDIWGLGVRGDVLFITDSGNQRIRAVASPPPPTDDLIIDLATSQALLDSLNAVAGSILMINVDGREYLVVPNATSVGLDVTLTGNDQLLVIDLHALQSAGGNITISGNLALQSVDLSSLGTVGGSLTVTGNPALSAILISGVTRIDGDLRVVGTAATVIDMSSLTTVSGSVDISGNTSATMIDMSSLTTVSGSVDVTGNTSATMIDMTALTTVSGSVDISGNTSATMVDMSSLTTVSGSIDLSDNPDMTVVDASSLTTVGGSIDLSGDTSLTTVDASALTTVGGSIDLSDNPSMTTIDMSSLTTVSGSIDLSDNPSMTTIDMSSLTTVSGSVEISGNTSAEEINMSSLATVGGDLAVSGNTSLTTVNMSSLTTVGGNLEVSDNTAATTINMSSVTAVNGTLEVSGNTGAETINMSGIATVGGDLIVVDNGEATVNMAEGADVGGNLTVETSGTGTFSMGDGSVGGNLSVDATGYIEVSGTSPGGNLDLTVNHPEALMHLQVQAATFETPVSFMVTRVEPVGLVPEGGLDAGGAAATIDPIAAYQFNFEVPTLDRDAALSFDITVAELDAATRTTLLDALASGTATLVTKGDAVGSVFQAFPVCSGGQTPTADGCVRAETFDALGQPTSGTPASVRFSNVVGHFSTWAVATVTRGTQANRTVLCSTLENDALLDMGFFEFSGARGEKVTVTLVPDPAGTFTPGRAALSVFGIGLFRLDASALPNTIAGKLRRTSTYYVTVSEPLWGKGKFTGAYCVSVESSGNAWRTFRRR